MMRVVFRALAASLMLLAPSMAFGGTCNPFPMLDASGSGNVNFRTALDGSSYCYGFTGILDSTGAVAFPAVAALSDSTSNPTTALFGVENEIWDATNSLWRRWPAVPGVGGGAKIDLSSIATTATATGHGVSGAGVQRVELPTDGTGVVGLNAGANTIGNVGLVAGSASLGTVGLNAGTNSIGTVQPGNTANTTPWLVQAVPQATGGAAVTSVIVANNTTSFVVDASPGTLYAVAAFSISNTAPAFVKLFNTAQGSVTCGTPTPKDRAIIPANQTQGAGYIWSVPVGVAYSTAITACVTGGIADNDTTAPAANTYIVDFYYK